MRERGGTGVRWLLVLAAVVVLAVGLTAPAAAQSTTDETAEADVVVDVAEIDGQVFFGQEVAITGLTAADDVVELRRGDRDDSTLADRYNTARDGPVVVNTSQLDGSEYFVRDDTGDHGPFEVTQQETEFEFDRHAITSGWATELVWESDNRAETVDLRIDAGGELGAGELERIFAAADASAAGDGSDAVIVEDVAEGDRLEADFAVDDVGEFEFTVEVLDTGATDDATIDVQDNLVDRVQWTQDTVTEDVGDVAEFEIRSMDDRDEVWFTLADDRDVFDVTVKVTEFDSGEPIELQWNTHHARDESETLGLSAENANVTVTSAEGPAFGSEGHLPNVESGWTFDLELFESEARVSEGDFADILVVDLQQRQTGELRTYTAPGVDALDHDDDIEDVLADASERDTVAAGDLLIAEIEVSGVFGYLDAEPSAFASDGLQFELAGPAGVFGAAPSVPVSDLEGAATIVERPEDDTIYVVIDSGEIPQIEDGNTWDAEFSVDGAENPYVEDESESEPEEVASDSFTYEDREIEIVGEFDDDRLVVPSSEDTEIAAETNVAPGTEVHLRVNLPQAYRTASGTVDEDGEFDATVDTAGFETGTQFRTVRVRAPNSETEHDVEAVVSDPDGPAFFSDVDAPEIATVGDDAALDVSVANAGGSAGTETVTVTVDGETVFEETVHLDAEAVWTESFDVDTTAAGSVSWSVSTSSDGSQGRIVVGSDETVTTAQLENQLYFGQSVTVQELAPLDDGSVQLRRGDAEDSTHVRSYDVGAGNEVTVDTGELEDDTYVLRDATGDHGPFEVFPQQTEFAFADDSVASGATAELVWESDNRAESVDLRIDAGGALDAETLERVFAAANASAAGDDSDAVIVEDVVEGDRLEADFDGIGSAEYEFTVEVLDTGATDDASITVDARGSEVQFVEDVVTEQVADVAEFEIEPQADSDAVWLTLADDRDVFDVTVKVTEFDGDEPVTITWNTHHARDESENLGLSAENANVTVTRAEGPAFGGGDHLPNVEDGWAFDVELFESETDVADGDFTDVLLVELQQRQTGELRTYTAPGVDVLDHDDDIEDVLADAIERDTVAAGDLLIAEIEASGVFGYLDAEPSAFASDGLQFELTGPGGAFTAGPSVPISELENAATIVERPEDDTIYVVVDSSEIPEIEAGDSWDAEFSVDGAENPYVDDDAADEPEEVVSDSFTYEDREIEIVGEFDDGRLVVPPSEDAEITAETNVAPGTDVHLRVNLPRDYRTASGTVDEDGTFTATVDLSDQEVGTALRLVRVRAPNGETEHSTEGVVESSSESSFVVDADAPENVAVGDDASIDVSVTNAGGTAGDAEIVGTVDGEPVVEQTVELEAGAEWTGTVELDTSDPGSIDWSISTQHDSVSDSVGVDPYFDGEYRPRRYEGSDKYYDVNGDGSLTNTDVTIFFANQHAPPWDDRTDLFDFDGDDEVGQSDVIELFEMVN